MVQVDLSKAEDFLEKYELAQAEDYSIEALANVRQATDMLGWRRILAEPESTEIEQINDVADKLRGQVDVLVVCGIGGSFLGGKAVIEALTPFFGLNQATEVIYAGYHLGGAYLNNLIRYLEVPKPDGTRKQVAVNVISKSGTTLETMLSFRVLRKWMHENFPDLSSERIICTTRSRGGVLNQLIDRYSYHRFIIPDDIGGRYSVLTPVGLLPAAVAGVDIQSLFNGAVSAFNNLEANNDDLLSYAVARFAFEERDKTVDVINSFEPELNGICRWMQQLLGESEGKDSRGIFPVVALYSSDLHSLGQFLQQGTPCMIETFIEVKNRNHSSSVQANDENIDQLNYLADQSFHQINQKAMKATRAAHHEGDVPCVTVSMDQMNARTVGEFLYFYELFTAVYCTMIGVDPFNQPGVEHYKQKMYKILGRNKQAQ